MGAINYKTSDFITLGYNTNNIEYEDPYYNELINDEYDEIKLLLNKERFYYFNITLEPGYYEGFTLDIEHNFSYFYDNYDEKKQALKEVKQIKDFLLYIVNNFTINAVYPGWCTGYADYKQTIKEINDAIEEMKNAVKNTPTFHILKARGEY